MSGEAADDAENVSPNLRIPHAISALTKSPHVRPVLHLALVGESPREQARARACCCKRQAGGRSPVIPVLAVSRRCGATETRAIATGLTQPAMTLANVLCEDMP